MTEITRLPEIEIYKNEDEWRWRITATNGKIIGASTEGYKNKIDCIKNMKSVGEQLSHYAISAAVRHEHGWD